MAHGCQAGLQQQACDDVFSDASRGDEATAEKLGAIGADLGAVACFFDRRGPRLAEPLARLSGVAAERGGLRLRALGRLTEAVEPMRVGLDMDVEEKDWNTARLCASNLSELELTRGAVSAAVTDGQRR